MRRALLPLVALAALSLAGCGKKVVKANGAEKSVVDVVSRQTGFTPKDVKCPSGVAAKVGGTFTCHFTGPKAVRYDADLRITKVKGDDVTFFVNTHPGG